MEEMEKLKSGAGLRLMDCCRKPTLLEELEMRVLCNCTGTPHDQHVVYAIGVHDCEC
jgi:hypothetical protein